MNCFHAVIKSFLLLALVCMTVMNPAILAAEVQSAACFPSNAAWSLTVDQVIKLKGKPSEELINTLGMTVHIYQASLFNRQYEASYFFGENGLYAILYTFPAPPSVAVAEFFTSLESAVNCQFNLPGVRLDTSKDEVELSQALWEDGLTLAYMSFFSTRPHEITLKFIDKKDESSQAEMELFHKIRGLHINEDMQKE